MPSPKTDQPWRNHYPLILAWLTALIFFSQGCVSLRVRQPLPEHLMDQAEVADLPGIRAWGDALSESLEKSAIESIKQQIAANYGKLEPEVDFLALSGAFGAGILCGWTEAGTRPRFKLVTGISTGALIAPFAFLGPEYDAKLKEAYTTISIVPRRKSPPSSWPCDIKAIWPSWATSRS